MYIWRPFFLVKVKMREQLYSCQTYFPPCLPQGPSGPRLLLWGKRIVRPGREPSRHLAPLDSGETARDHGYLSAYLPRSRCLSVLLWSHALQETHQHCGWVSDCTQHSTCSIPTKLPTGYTGAWSHSYRTSDRLLCMKPSSSCLFWQVVTFSIYRQFYISECEQQ